MAKLTKEEIIKRVLDISKNTLSCSFKEEYKNKDQHIEFKHLDCGNVFTRSIGSVIHGKIISCPLCKPSVYAQNEDILRSRLLGNGYKLIEVLDNNTTDRGSSIIEFIDCGCTGKKHNSGLYKGSTKCRIHSKTLRKDGYTQEKVDQLLLSLKYGSFHIKTDFTKMYEIYEIHCNNCSGTFKESLQALKNRNGKCKICFGTVKSIQEEYIAILLSDLGLNFSRQYKLDKYYFDFLLADYDIVIEYDGPHHITNSWFNHELKTIEHDVIKNKLAEDNNLKLYRIAHTDNVLRSILNIYEDVQRLEQ